MQQAVTISESGGTIRAAIAGELDHHAAKTIRDAVDRRLFAVKPAVLCLDFSAVSFMDSSGIGLILGRCSVCESIGTHVRVTGLSEQLMKLVRLSGIERVRNLSII